MISYRCNLDDYGDITFPGDVPRVPMKGEMIEAKMRHHDTLRDAGLPIALEVCRVTFREGGVVVVELWFSDTDAQALHMTPRGKFNRRR